MPLATRLDQAVAARHDLIDAAHESAFRLFNGFHEGCPDLAIDIYARTAVIHDYAETSELGAALVDDALAWLRQSAAWIQAAVVKTRRGETAEERRGTLAFGTAPDTEITEHGVRYAIDLAMNRDASFYLDTRHLRRWVLDHVRDRSVLNTFAYTGSLGVAARAGGASEIVQLDLNRRFLALAERSFALNGFPPRSQEILSGDFFPRISQLKRAGRRFDCVLLDPPFFASSTKGVVDLAANTARLINKVRPLINDGGHLVAVNNALFVSGREQIATLETLCADGYLSIESLIPIPEDFTGYPGTRVGHDVTDPAPFNHSTKIAVLRVRRKAEVVRSPDPAAPSSGL